MSAARPSARRTRRGPLAHAAEPSRRRAVAQRLMDQADLRAGFFERSETDLGLVVVDEDVEYYADAGHGDTFSASIIVRTCRSPSGVSEIAKRTITSETRTRASPAL